MAKSNKPKTKQDTSKKNNTNNTTKSDIPVLKNPTNSLWGKIIIWILIFGTIGVILISAIVAIVIGISR